MVPLRPPGNPCSDAIREQFMEQQTTGNRGFDREVHLLSTDLQREMPLTNL